MTPRPGASTLRRAYFALALVPVGLIAAFFLGKTIATLLGYGDAGEDLPPWAIAASGLPAMALALSAPIAATLLGRRAWRQTGNRLAHIPAVLGALITLFTLTFALAPFA